jgi:hypothetical protein
MTTGAAYDLCQAFGWKHGLYRKPTEAKKFYVAIAIFTFDRNWTELFRN